jgi:hypothetical protein
MGSDYLRPAIDVEYRPDRSADSTAEEHLQAFSTAFTSFGRANLGPVDQVWITRPDVP